MEPRVKAAVKRARAARTMRVVSAAGTDLTVDMREASTAGVWGWTYRPKTVAHWPGGIVVSFPRAASVNSTLALDAGDVNLTFKRYLESPVLLTIEADYVTRIDGKGTDAELMRRYWAAWGDREAYAVSHVGWGLDERAHWHGLTQFGGGMGMELRSFYGNVMFSIGPNNELGGPNDTPCHFDIPMRGNSLYLDDELIVDNGELTVTREAGAADCTIHGERAVFDEVVAGRANAVAAVLRGALVCHGDLELMVAIQRIFPDPPRGWDPTAGTRSAS